MPLSSPFAGWETRIWPSAALGVSRSIRARKIMICGHVLPKEPLYMSKREFALPSSARRTAPPRLIARHGVLLTIPERTQVANSIPGKTRPMCQILAIAVREAGSHVHSMGRVRSGRAGPRFRSPPVGPRISRPLLSKSPARRLGQNAEPRRMQVNGVRKTQITTPFTVPFTLRVNGTFEER